MLDLNVRLPIGPRQNLLWYEAVFLKLGTTNVHQEEQNDALSAVAMTTVLPLVLC